VFKVKSPHTHRVIILHVEDGYAPARLGENPTTHKCAPAAIVFVM